MNKTSNFRQRARAAVESAQRKHAFIPNALAMVRQPAVARKRIEDYHMAREIGVPLEEIL